MPHFTGCCHVMGCAMRCWSRLAVAMCYGVPLKCMLLCDMLCCETANYKVCCYVIWCAVRWWIVPWIVACYILPRVAEVYCVGVWDRVLCYCVLSCKHIATYRRIRNVRHELILTHLLKCHQWFFRSNHHHRRRRHRPRRRRLRLHRHHRHHRPQ